MNKKRSIKLNTDVSGKSIRSFSKSHFKNTYDNRSVRPLSSVKYFVYSSAIWKSFIDCVPFEGKVADFGCGQGTILHCLEDQGYKNLYGIDFVKAIPDGFLNNVKFIKGDVLDIPVENEAFDAVVSTMVIEHVDDKRFVSEIHRVLKPGGVALVTSVLKNKFSWYFYKNIKGETVIDPTHIREYTNQQDYESLFKEKFDILQIEKTILKFSVLDLIFRMFLDLFKSKKLKDLSTTNVVLRKLRGVRIPVPGYYAIEILVRKKY